jgi:hypothetical protein
MTIRAEQLETEVLANLHLYPEGKRDDSIAGWGNSMQQTFGERPSPADIVASLRRLRNRGLIRLIKFVTERNVWYDYTADEQVDDGWFFYKATFIVAITDEGRGIWDVSSRPIGFKQPA